MGIICVWNCDLFRHMHSCFRTICRTGVEIVGIYSPSVYPIQVYSTAGIVSPENYVILDNIVSRIERIERSALTIVKPELLRTFCTISHSSTICIWIPPIGSSLILNSIWNAISIKIVWEDIILRVTFRIS